MQRKIKIGWVVRIIMRIGIIGSGIFGSSLAYVFSSKHESILLWSHSGKSVDTINKEHHNNAYLPGTKFIKNVRCTQDIKEVLKTSDILMFAISAQKIRDTLMSIVDDMPLNVPIIICSKGIEQITGKLLSDIFIEIFSEKIKINLFILSGPSFAKELVKDQPAAVALANVSMLQLEKMQPILSTDILRIYGVNDIIGVQIAGALKNIIAIAVGISDYYFGSNTRAALMTRGLAEIARLGQHLGAKPLTFMGLAGMGDLVLTCTGSLSRNKRVGLELGKGKSLKTILGEIQGTAEGIYTTECIYQLAQEKNIQTPIIRIVYEMLYKNKIIDLAVKELASHRPLFE